MLTRLRPDKNIWVETAYQDAIYQYISSATVLINSKVEELNRSTETSTTINPARSMFHRINDNSFDSMLKGGEEMVSDIKDLIKKKISIKIIYLVIIKAVIIFISLIAFCLLIRYVFLIMKSNKDIMGLFGMIKKEDITRLSVKCAEFMNVYLSDYIAAANIDKDEDSEDSEGLE